MNPVTSSPNAVEEAVLAVLAGTPPEHAAAQAAIDPVDLAHAVTVYQAAGRAALGQLSDWCQVRVHFTDWDAAEATAVRHLEPALRQAQDSGAVAGWWLLRKYPCWRLRCRPGPGSTPAAAKAALARILDPLIREGSVQRWWESPYEPETLAFGGDTGMRIAHDLFHADSCGILTYLGRLDVAEGGPLPGRREISVLLCTTLLRAAEQDHDEQGDIWHRVANLRPLAEAPSVDRLHTMASGLRRLMALDTSPAGTLFAPGGPLVFAAPWATVFATAGRALAEADRDGALQRGLRAILANHVIFHFNRLGIPTPTQAVLARAARDTLINPAEQ